MGNHHCHTSECHASGHHHHHSCGCCQSGHETSCSCCQKKCSCHDHNEFAKQLIQMADAAWMEVLQDKIKKEIEKTNGSHLDQLAKLVAESNHERWKNKMAQKDAGDNYEDKISEFFRRKS